MEDDIRACGNQTEASGSKKLYDELIARYTTFDSAFSNGLPRYAKLLGANSVLDYRPELNAIAAKLKTYLLMNEISEENTMTTRSRKTINQLLAEDIERCELYLSNPDGNDAGQMLYIEITSRYDSVINGLGNGLYNYYADQHFYDPDIKGKSLIHNLRVLNNKLISYQAEKYPPKDGALVEKANRNMSNKVFIVHGHDNEAKQEMARTLQNGGFEPIILHEKPDSGRTIIEKIERYSDVCYAVVLYTECDIGRDKNTPVEQERNRARQNVVFEHGYLIGKLSRDHVSALVKGNVETPGDIDGVIYIPMDAAGAWKIQLAKNMQDVGLPVDMNTFCQ